MSVAAGCAVMVEPAPAPVPVLMLGRASVAIPRGHMPPPGACRIWFPDRPPGQQALFLCGDKAV
ncbi:MAG: hypothetical protein EHM59_00340 [Betaproteobacteria bacterium]|nr:MAG: hypothetical protein EHM59_00340 [Betaproteobacteria bacterium]